MNFENANPGPPNDAPSLGAVVGKVEPGRAGLPPSITLPHRIFNTDGSIWPGQDAGFLGRTCDPWLLSAGLSPERYPVRETDLPAELDLSRLSRRQSLLGKVERGLEAFDHRPPAGTFDDHARRAFELLSSAQARRAFRIEDEPQAIRDLYGVSPFGRSVLLARRLIESGVRLVQVNWFRSAGEPPDNPCWDSHTAESSRLKDVLTPPSDRAFSGLIMDLHRRGLLEETLVVCMAEFGRTPRLDRNGGRNHWGSVFSIVLAGGGVAGGQVFGASDRIGAYPLEGRVRPEDLSATIFHCLGHTPETEYHDLLGRPHPMSRGDVLHNILN
jgi:hypothetical protein